jgi:hypothetical protein
VITSPVLLQWHYDPGSTVIESRPHFFAMMKMSVTGDYQRLPDASSDRPSFRLAMQLTVVYQQGKGCHFRRAGEFEGALSDPDSCPPLWHGFAFYVPKTGLRTVSKATNPFLFGARRDHLLYLHQRYSQ